MLEIKAENSGKTIIMTDSEDGVDTVFTTNKKYTLQDAYNHAEEINNHIKSISIRDIAND